MIRIVTRILSAKEAKWRDGGCLLVGDDALEVAAEPVRDVILGKVREVLWQQWPQRGPMLLHKPLHVLQ